MAKQILIGERVFKTKKSAIEHMQLILNGPPMGTRVVEPGHGFLLDLVSLHPDADSKIGCGVSHFSIAQDDFRKRCFRLYRLDGTNTDFSVYKCFEGKHNVKAQVQLALRTAIRPQIVAFREKQLSSGPVTCPYSGEVLTRERCHVDHGPPYIFDALAQGWMAAYGLILETVAITASADDQQGRTLTDSTQIASWQAYHELYASLRLISIRANLSDAKVAHNRSGRTAVTTVEQ
ncbi:DCL family protein [Granulicella mallensis]|uniref:Uncharacterized protein n=1 Tax=Granulicella mallensis (strain ATCC BAA-1857 / DSM 23137 / MP5ACTX8) TaxID=682795 RepID=G8NT27_GRAMM|nr:DCL family protein [Granulicella mallensis]AEU37457.1 Protein of unknown function DUF3223 [Granulicella mallensis MP5ACTX8]